MKKNIEGIITPLVTPLLSSGALDIAGLGSLLEAQVAAGVQGVFVLGTTGEGPALSITLQQQVIMEACKSINGRLPVLAGISAASIAETLKIGQFAAEAGADAVVAAPPCYLPLDDTGLEEFFATIAKDVSLPLYIYNMPSMTKTVIPNRIIKRLSEIPQIVGYKDSSGNIDEFNQLIAEIKRDDFSLLMGPETMMAEVVLMGAHGGVNSGANLYPQLLVACYKAAKNNDLEKTRFLQGIINHLQKIYCFRQNKCWGVISGIKFILEMNGLCSSKVSLPIKAYSENEKDKLTKIHNEIIRMMEY